MRVYSFAGRNSEGGYAMAGRLEFPADEEAEAARRTAEQATRKAGHRQNQAHCRRKGPRLPARKPA